MRFWTGQTLFASCLLLLLMLDSARSSEVVVLTDANFEHLTQASTGQTTGKWFVKFFAPWCGHCKRMSETWKELAADMEANHSDDGIVIADLDGTENRETNERFGVRGFPTLLFFASGKVYKYQGDRSLQHMKDFCLGEYAKAEASDIAPPPSWIEKQRKKWKKFYNQQKLLTDLSADFEHIMRLRKNAAAVLVGIGFVAGTLVTVIISILFGPKTEKKTKAD